MTALGTTKKKFVYLCEGNPGPKVMFALAHQIIAFAGMTPARKGRIDKYPYQGGGGKGYTLYQPLMESYLVADVYSDLNQTEITLSTCKPERINQAAMEIFMQRLIGPVLRSYAI